MAKLVYEETDSILIRNVLKIGLKTLKKKNALNSFEDLQRISTIIREMDTVEEPKKESGSTAVASHCENCEV
jgi:hypothetical protein